MNIILQINRIFNKLKTFSPMLSYKEKAVFAIIIIVAMLIPPLWGLQNLKRGEVNELRLKKQQFALLAEEYKSLKNLTDNFEKRGELTKSRGLLEESNSLFESLGLRKKIKSVKGLGSRDLKDSYAEESVVISAENLTVNEIVNLFYKIDRAPMMLSVKSFSIKRSFEDPENMHLHLNLALFVKK